MLPGHGERGHSGWRLHAAPVGGDCLWDLHPHHLPFVAPNASRFIALHLFAPSLAVSIQNTRCGRYSLQFSCCGILLPFILLRLTTQFCRDSIFRCWYYGSANWTDKTGAVGCDIPPGFSPPSPFSAVYQRLHSALPHRRSTVVFRHVCLRPYLTPLRRMKPSTHSLGLSSPNTALTALWLRGAVVIWFLHLIARRLFFRLDLL